MTQSRGAPPCLRWAFWLVAIGAAWGQAPPTRTKCLSQDVTSQDVTSIDAVSAASQEVRATSFPELSNVNLEIHTFHSQADYFRTRFSLPRFFFLQRMRYFVEVNPALYNQGAPADGVCSVLAHELAHVVALQHGNRIRRLGLVRLLSGSFTARFERKTDLEAIRRGYGDGLKSYRSWVYAHIPPRSLAAKRRNYFSPKEIEKIQGRLREQPDLFGYWSRHVPLSLAEVLRDRQ